MKLFLASVLLFGMSSCLPARLSEGKIIDKQTELPIIGAKVTNKSKMHETCLSDSAGRFRLISSRSFFAFKAVTLIIEKEAYVTREIKFRKSVPKDIWLEYKYTLRYNAAECLASQDSIDGQKVYISVEKMPEFPGGEASMIKYFSNNFEPPLLKAGSDYQSPIFTSFIIDTIGKVKNQCIEKPYLKSTLSPDELEALRIINAMPIWQPGRTGGKKVPVKIKCPIRIRYW